MLNRRGFFGNLMGLLAGYILPRQATDDAVGPQFDMQWWDETVSAIHPSPRVVRWCGGSLMNGTNANDPMNWEGGVAPASGDDVVIYGPIRIEGGHPGDMPFPKVKSLSLLPDNAPINPAKWVAVDEPPPMGVALLVRLENGSIIAAMCVGWSRTYRRIGLPPVDVKLDWLSELGESLTSRVTHWAKCGGVGKLIVQHEPQLIAIGPDVQVHGLPSFSKDA